MRKRRSEASPEPGERWRRRRWGANKEPRFIIQHHVMRSDHYNFHLEIDSMLVSWALPKGPSIHPKDKRMARRTEDHPLEYAAFEKITREGESGAGGVIVWDRGIYTNATKHGMAEGLQRGHLSFRLYGEKLNCGYALTRIREGEDETWLLIERKDKDQHPDAPRKQVRTQSEPLLSGHTLDDLAEML
jgi:DNA ligase D-like protein (predicted 3'-phosphoesterase)